MSVAKKREETERLSKKYIIIKMPTEKVKMLLLEISLTNKLKLIT